MERLLNWSKNNPALVMILIIICSAFFASQLKNIEIDPSFDKLLVPSDPEKVYYHKTEEIFGSDNITTIFIKDENLTSPEKLEAIEEVIYELEEVDEVQKIDSLFTTPNFYNDNGTLTTVPLIDGAPETQEQAEQLFNIGIDNPLFVNQMLSPDKKSMTLLLYAQKKQHDVDFNFKIASKIEEILKPLEGKVDQVFQIGTPLINTHVADEMIRDQKVMVPTAIFIIMILLMLGLRSINAGVIPLISGCFSILWTLGAMSMLDIPAQILITAVPVILFVIGSTEDTHLLSEYLEGIEHRKDRLFAIRYMSKKVGFAVLLTTITTITGFATVTLNKITMLKEFAIVTAMGLAFNFIITMTVIPVYLRYFGATSSPLENHNSLAHRIFNSIGKFFTNLVFNWRPYIFIGIFIFSGASIYFARNIQADNDYLRTLKESSMIRQRINVLTESFSGINNFFIVLKKKDSTRDDFKKSTNLSKVFEIHQFVQNNKDFDSAQSYAGHIALINREMKAESAGFSNKSTHYKIPSDDKLISQYSLLLSRDDLERYVTADFREANIVVRHNITSSIDFNKALDNLHNKLETILSGTNLEYKLTSKHFLINKAAGTIIDAQVESIGLIVICIFGMIWLLFFNFKAAVVSLVPNLIPVIGLFGIMGFFGVPLDMGTCLVATISLGVAADDTIHFFTRYNANMRTYHDSDIAIKETVHAEIKPIVTTSLSIGIGLAMLGLSSFVPLIEFGLFTAAIMMLALLSDLLITPALLLSSNLGNMISVVEAASFRVKPQVYNDSPIFRGIETKLAKKFILSGAILEYNEETRVTNIDLNENLLLVLDGKVKIAKKGQRQGDQDEQIQLLEMTSGAIYGSFGKNTTQNEQLICSAHTKLLLITPSYVETMAKQSPSIHKQLLSNIESISSNPLYR